MAETIESFVSKLQTEGVEAGRKQARQIKDQAQGEADKIVADARAEAEKIVANARREAESIVSRGRTELQLAARDATLRLRETLSRALRQVLHAETDKSLRSEDLLKQVLPQVIQAYAEADAKGAGAIELNLPTETKDRLADWAVSQLGGRADLKGTLDRAGFEYSVGDATVEVTVDSVVEILSELVGPRLREVLEKATAEERE